MTTSNRHPFSPGPVPEDLADFFVGQPVVHEDFGLGEILQLEEGVARVIFDSGLRMIDLRARKLLPIDHPNGFVFRSIRYHKRPDADELEVVSRASKYVTKVDIPGMLALVSHEYPVTRIRERAFAYMENLRSVNIPPTLHDIAPDAFEGSRGIAQVNQVSSGAATATLVQDASGFWGVIANPAKKQSAIPREYEQIRFYAARLSAKQKMPTYYFLVQQGGLWGLLSKTGRVQVACIYDTLEPVETGGFFKGFAFCQGDSTGMIDGRGEIIKNE